jgi:hypothetical protein
MAKAKDISNSNISNRRNMLKAFSVAAFASVGASAIASEKPAAHFNKDVAYRTYANVNEVMDDSSLKENQVVKTLGYSTIGDGGHAEYIIQKKQHVHGGSIALKNRLFATLINVSFVNYKMFGVISDGQNDDGIQIKAAHTYSNHMNIPVINHYGEYWIKDTSGIKILGNVEWGNSIFHIDERFNSAKVSRFEVVDRQAQLPVDFTSQEKSSFLKQLKPGVRIIPELAPYKNSLVIIADKNDAIGFRAGAKFVGQSWAREEFFYVEEHGRIIGDIAWEFKDYTSLIAYPASNSFLTISGGTFYLSGDSAGKGYTRNGFSISRSRTIIKNQWVGLEPGKNDVASNPRNGFYSFSRVYDITLENIRLIPYEQDREGTEKDVPAGTYGISAARMLNGTFRNVIAEGSGIHWGVFGTNLNKNFRIENCRLNRVDVHFHCWNLYINNSIIGYRGISVTGGGDLFIENSTCENANFINFRRDFGSKWDGNIRISNCRFIPAGKTNAVLDFNPMDFDHKYPVGFGRSIIVENLTVDYTGSGSESVCWMMRTPAFPKLKHGQRLFFPHHIEFRNVFVEGRETGLRLMKIAGPQNLDLRKKGNYDGVQLLSNAKLIFDNIQLENLDANKSNDDTHLSVTKYQDDKYEDQFSLYPEFRFLNCKGLAADFGGNIADVSFERCAITKLSGGKRGMPGKFSLKECLLQPSAHQVQNISFILESELGTSFTNCTLHSPRINGEFKPELVDHINFIKMNKEVKYNHLNTSLGRDIINYYKSKGETLKPEFLSMLKCHHELETTHV